MISVHVIVRGAAAASEWYQQVLGAVPGSRIELPDGRLIDVRLDLGGSEVVLADEFPEHDALSPEGTGASTAVLSLHCDDVDAVWARALAGGATVLRDLTDVLWGSGRAS